MRVTLPKRPKSIIVFKLWDKTRGRQWCVCSEAQHAIVKSDKTCRTVDSLLAEQVGIHLDLSGKLLWNDHCSEVSNK